jgi:hypothetical protein
MKIFSLEILIIIMFFEIFISAYDRGRQSIIKPGSGKNKKIRARQLKYK